MVGVIMKKIAVVLAGCGVKDGSEIHEAVITLLTIKRNNADYECFALNKNQYEVINHATNQSVTNEQRTMFVESARISRGEIKDLTSYDPKEFDALIFPGGLGVAKNLFTYAIDGVDCEIDSSVLKAILDTREAKKPIGAICISPLLIARAFKDSNVKPKVTIGNDEELIAAVKNFGGRPEKKKVNEICYDETFKIVSTPAYTIAKDISEVASGIEILVKKIIEIS